MRGSIDKTHLIDSFFIYIAPLFEKFDCPLIFPTHESYLAYGTYEHIEKNVVDIVETIPALSIEAFSQMLDHKVKSVLEESKLEDFIDREAVALAYSQVYQKRTDDRMRDSLRIIRGSVMDAVQHGFEKIDLKAMAHHLLD